MSGTPQILVVDDNKDLADGIAMLLRELPAEVNVAYGAEEGTEWMSNHPVELVLTDVRMPGIGGMELLEQITERWPGTQVIMLTGYGSIDAAVQALKKGAYNYLTKPFDNDALIEVVRAALAAPTRPKVDDLAIVGDIAATVAPHGDLLPSIDRALEILRNATEADDCELFLREPQGGDLLLSSCCGAESDALYDQVRFGAGTGYPGIIAETGQPMVITDLAADTRFLRKSVVERGLTECVCVPLKAPAGEQLGSLNVFSKARGFATEQLARLLEQIAAPITNALLAGFAHLRRSIDEVTTNADTEEGLGDETLKLLLQRIQQMAGARSGTLSLTTPDGVTDRVVSTGTRQLLCSKIESGELGSCSAVVAGHAFAPATGRRTWPKACRSLPGHASKPCCLPLMANDQLFGVVVLEYGRRAQSNAPGRLVSLLAMAQQTAIRLKPLHTGLNLAKQGDEDQAPTEQKRQFQLQCLGPFHLLLNDKEIAPQAFSRSKALALLKVLVLKNGGAVSGDTLAELLWPGVEQKAGINRLHGVIHALRSVIEPHRSERRWIYICNHADLYYFNKESAHTIDLFRFNDALHEAKRSSEPTEKLALLERVVGLYRGDLFADDLHAEWCFTERVNLRESYLEAAGELAQLLSSAKRYNQAITCLRQALKHDALREDLHQSLIQLLIQVGRRKDALAQYRRCEELIRDQLDADLLPETKALFEILSQS